MADDMKEKIVSALALLNHEDDSHWTDDGLPRTGVIQKIANDKEIKRTDITAAKPGFMRVKGDEMGDPPESTGDGQRIVDATPASDGASPHAPTNVPDASDDEEAHLELSDDQIHQLLAENIVEAEHELEAARARVSAANADVIELQKRIQKARIDYDRRFPPLTEAQNIKQFLDAENAKRAHAAGTPGVYHQPAQIDMAMQRGNSRGWRRPRRDPILAATASRG